MPVQRRKKQAVVSFFLILLILLFDQSTKLWVKDTLNIGESIPLIKNILHITFVSNTGAAFGLFKQSTAIFIIISIVAVFIIGSIIIRSILKRQFFDSIVFNLSLSLIFSGALGNLIDRVKYGYVVDFIDVRIWPVFNISDISITTGSFLLILFYLRKSTSK
ncbi:MAG: signal peptidase II [Candidatus Omnitrophota bacterium]